MDMADSDYQDRERKLGEEVEEAALTDKQRVLRKVASAQQFDELLPAHVARPVWGGGLSSIANRLMQF